MNNSPNNTIPQKQTQNINHSEELKELVSYCLERGLNPKAYTSLQAFIKYKKERSDQDGNCV